MWFLISIELYNKHLLHGIKKKSHYQKDKILFIFEIFYHTQYYLNNILLVKQNIIYK
jgi:hypothetical protein